MTQDDTGTTMTQSFLVVYTAGPNWIAGQPMADQVPGAHGRYMLQLYTKGAMKYAGPFTDDSGGAVLLESADLRTATAWVDADPAVIAGVFSYTIKPWKLLPWETYAASVRG